MGIKYMLHAIFFSLLLSIIGTLFFVSQSGRHLEENLGLAVLFKIRGSRQPPDNVIILNIDFESSNKLGLPENPNKWPRSIYAKVLQKLKDYGAAVIVFDMHFADQKLPADDQLFAEAVSRAGNVILFEKLVRRKMNTAGDEYKEGPVDLEVQVPPITVLADAALALAPFPIPKVPVRINQAWTFKTSAGDIPTLPVVALQALALSRYESLHSCMQQIAPGESRTLPISAEQALSEFGLVETMRRIRSIAQDNIPFHPLTAAPSAACDNLQIEDRRLAEALINVYGGDNNIFLNYYGPPGTLSTHPFHHVLSPKTAHNASLKTDVKDAVVFIGVARTTWSEQKDGFFTVYTQPDGLDLSGVELAATVFANLKENKPLRPLPVAASVLILIVSSVICSLASFLLTPIQAVAALTAFLACGLYTARLFFSQSGIWPPVVIPLAVIPAGSYLTAILYKYVRSRRERKHIQKALKLYLPENVVEEISKDLAFIKTGDRMVYGVCLLTDAVNYTSLSENLMPTELSSVMNRYFQCLFKQVNEHDGLVCNVIGDTMFALWPSTEPQLALKVKACRAALKIQAGIEEFNRDNPDQALPTRIGLHSGHLLMGNIGAEGHFEYAPVGDIVNTSSRIEGLNKRLGTWILASEETVQQCDVLTTRLMGEFLLSGKSRPVTIYQLMPDEDEDPGMQRLRCELFPDALALFQKRQWKEASTVLRRCLELHTKDGPSRFYLELCTTYLRNPPDVSWDGVIPVSK